MNNTRLTPEDQMTTWNGPVLAFPPATVEVHR